MRRPLSRALGLATILATALLVAAPAAADDLIAAVKARNTQRVLALLEGGANPDSSSPYGGSMNLAAALGPPEIVIALLDAGADPHTRGFGGATPLHAAVLSGQSEITRILLERGVEIEALDNLVSRFRSSSH